MQIRCSKITKHGKNIREQRSGSLSLFQGNLVIILPVNNAITQEQHERSEQDTGFEIL